jgi:putative transposase
MGVLDGAAPRGGSDAPEPVHAGTDRRRLAGARGGGGDGGALSPHGISEQTFYRWKQKYGGLERGEATRPEGPGRENARLKRLVAEQALDNQILKDLLRKNA